MCNVAVIPWIVAGLMAVQTVVTMRAENRAAREAANNLAIQNANQQEEIADQAGNEINERARAARRERAAARVSASEAGINLGSNSFLAMLQASEISESIDSGLILRGEKLRQRSRESQYRANLSQLTRHTGLGIATGAVVAGVQGYFGAGGNAYMGRQPGRG